MSTGAEHLSIVGGRNPPGPVEKWCGLPLLRKIQRDYLGTVTALQRGHGDVVATRLGPERVVDLFHPELVREVLLDHAESTVRWERGTEAAFAQRLRKDTPVAEADAGGGDSWQRRRRVLTPEFTPKRSEAFARLMVQAARPGLQQVLPSESNRGLVDMEALCSRLTMDVILASLFGLREDDPAREVASTEAAHALEVLSRTALREMFSPFTLPDWLPLPRKVSKRSATHMLHGLVSEHIEARRRAVMQGAEPGEDLLGRLISVRDEATGTPLSDPELFDLCMIALQAGYENTATALLWWGWLMARHKDAAERAHAEVRVCIGEREPQASDVAGLLWLSATLKEAMRLYPPVAALMSRRAVRDFQLGEWRIASRSMIRLTPWVLHRDPRWFDAPDSFRPERFLPGAQEIMRGAWLPFGVGPRVCLGQHFAMLQMLLLGALLLQHYRLAPAPGAAEPVPTLSVTLRPRDKLWLLLERVSH